MVEIQDLDNFSRFPPQECWAWTIPEIALNNLASLNCFIINFVYDETIIITV